MPREPWFKVKIGIRRSGKMAELPSDSARLGYLYVLAEAKVQRQMGVFDSRHHFAEVLGRFGRYLPQYLELSMLHEAPLSCAACKRRHAGLRKGQIVVHDFLKEQRDPTNADRQAAWRETRDEEAEAEPDNGDRNGDRNGVHNAEVTASVTANETGSVTATVTPISRARATTATVTGTRTSTERGSTRPSTSQGARADQRPVDPSDEEGRVPW